MRDGNRRIKEKGENENETVIYRSDFDAANWLACVGYKLDT